MLLPMDWINSGHILLQRHEINPPHPFGGPRGSGAGRTDTISLVLLRDPRDSSHKEQNAVMGTTDYRCGST